ncbi:MAG: SpoIID/LytB domain-containing protein [Acidobacteria bacterium]|nr:SpoIID/LytB domain-containing protein [Acidobacteriota bacterium]
MAGRAAACLLLALPLAAPAQQVRVGVLGLFHPQALEVRTEAETFRVRLDPEGRGILVETPAGARLLQRLELPGPFELAAPGKLRRSYAGSLELTAASGELRAVVGFELEDAVAAIVAAETAPDWPLDALEAQAIVTRSYLAAGRNRHDGFDFCDTTHCQWMAGAVGPGHAAARAARRTAGWVLTYRMNVIEALFSRRCGGRTQSLAAVGLSPAVPGGEAYPYFPVDCPVCRRASPSWTRDLPAESAQEALLRPGSEAARLAVTRRLGWSALPSNDYRVTRNDGRLAIEGSGEGHGVGLCQRGAKELAAEGLSAARILSLYFPGVRLGRP